nr:hypothetical protein [uncultured Blautia sp.]
MKLRLVKQGDFMGTKYDFYVDENNNIYETRSKPFRHIHWKLGRSGTERYTSS